MDDLSFDSAEGPATGVSSFDEYGDEFDDYDESEFADDEFIGSLIQGVGQLVGRAAGADGFEADEEVFEDEEEGFEAFDEFDAFDAYAEGDDFEEEAYEAFESAVADALDAEDTEEFLGLLRRAATGIGRVARRAAPVLRRAGRTVGQVARTVAPIASAIPLPQARR